MIKHERRAYICMKCEPPNRTFLAPGEKEPPKCPHHGKMIRQANVPYTDPRPPKPEPAPKPSPRGRSARAADGRRGRA